MSCCACQVARISSDAITYTDNEGALSSFADYNFEFGRAKPEWYYGQTGTFASFGGSMRNDTGGFTGGVLTEQTDVTIGRFGHPVPMKMRYDLVTYDLLTASEVSRAADIEFTWAATDFTDRYISIAIPANERYVLVENMRFIFPQFNNY